MADRNTKKGSALGGAGPSVIDQCRALLAAARSPAAVPRAYYVAAARTAYDAAEAELARLRLNLEALEREYAPKQEARHDG